MFDRETFDTIFSDAAVEDVDFAEWDRRIDLFVRADHMPLEGGHMPLYRISFLAPHSFGMEFNREAIDRVIGPGDCLGWWIEESRIERVGPLWNVLLLPSQPCSPQLRVLCEDLEITRESASALLSLFPETKDRPMGVFARPSLSKLLAGVRKRHH